jgi:hypothetical protein
MRGDFELFDLAHDPGELHDLHGTGRSEEEALKNRLLDFMIRHEAGKPETGNAAETLSPETRERLKALGYLK